MEALLWAQLFDGTGRDINAGTILAESASRNCRIHLRTVSVQPAHLLIACTAPHPLLFQQGIHMETFQSRREFWAGHVSAWLGGGLTQVVYCQQHELKPKSFSYWVRRHRQAAGHVTLVPLAVQKPSATGELLLQHASGWQLALPTGVDAVWLAGLLRGMA